MKCIVQLNFFKEICNFFAEDCNWFLEFAVILYVLCLLLFL